MWPTITEVQTALGPQPVNTYGLFMLLAFSGAFLLIHVRARAIGINPDRLIPGYVAAAVGGMIGARILYALSVDLDRTLANPASLLSCAGFAVYGGIIGGIIGVAIFVFASKLPPWKMADIAAPGVILGMGIGRMACFFAGCCHGAIAPTPHDPVGLLPQAFTGGQLWLSGTAPFLTNEVHGGVGRLHDVPLYPTQLWAVFVLVPLALFLFWKWPRRRYDGQIAALTLLIEPPTRAFIEAFRADERGYFVSWTVSERVAALIPGMSQAGEQLGTQVMGITTSQGLAVVFMSLGAAIWWLRRNTPVDTTVPVPAPEEGDLLEELA
jgi:phosphatidylglycerol:prolipoprotein diacylglycerol transferase